MRQMIQPRDEHGKASSTSILQQGCGCMTDLPGRSYVRTCLNASPSVSPTNCSTNPVFGGFAWSNALFFPRSVANNSSGMRSTLKQRYPSKWCSAVTNLPNQDESRDSGSAKKDSTPSGLCLEPPCAKILRGAREIPAKTVKCM
eukprot:927963-Amphidinium_carterae.1